MKTNTEVTTVNIDPNRSAFITKPSLCLWNTVPTRNSYDSPRVNWGHHLGRPLNLRLPPVTFSTRVSIIMGIRHLRGRNGKTVAARTSEQDKQRNTEQSILRDTYKHCKTRYVPNTRQIKCKSSPANGRVEKALNTLSAGILA